MPGPRSYALLAPVEFPWKQSVDHIEHVGSHDSYNLSLKLCRNGVVCGPSSGFNLQGLFSLLEKRKAEGTLSQLAEADGLVHCVFLCCDLPYQYINEYFSKLGPEAFPPITNEVCSAVNHEVEQLTDKLAAPDEGRPASLRRSLGTLNSRNPPAER